MAKKTIIKKWAEDTHNKYELSEEQIKTGIARLGNIVSNQLNAVANRADIMIDLLQRCSAWNVNKVYQQGDICMVSIYYKRPSDAQHKYYIMFLISTKNDNTEIPLINNGATSFTRNDDLSTPRFTITANSEIILSNFVNGMGWAFADSTCGDLTNCVNLAVSEVAHFKGNTSFDGNVVANSNINLAGNLTTQGHLELAGTANFNSSVTLNGLVNTATTPANNAVANEIITAKWARDYIVSQASLQKQNSKVFIDRDIKLNIGEEQKISLTFTRDFFFNVLKFGWILTLTNNNIYKSKSSFDFNVNILDSNFPFPYLGLANEVYKDMFYDFTFYDNNVGGLEASGVKDLSTMSGVQIEYSNTYIGTFNGAEFEYTMRFTNNGNNILFELEKFSSVEEVTGNFKALFF